MSEDERERSFTDLLDGIGRTSGGSTDCDVPTCSALLKACRSNEHCFTAISLIPKLMKCQDFTEKDFALIADSMPVDFLRSLLEHSVDGESASDAKASLAVNVLASVVLHCPAEAAASYATLARPLRRALTARRFANVSEVEDAFCVWLRITDGERPDAATAANAVGVLTAVGNAAKRCTDELPPLGVLRGVRRLLERFSNASELAAMSRGKPWPRDLRIVIQRLLQTRNIPDEYRDVCIALSAQLADAFDADWLRDDPPFAALLASLTHAQFRLLLDDPSKIKTAEVLPCCSLAEFFLRSVDSDDDFLDEQRATQVSRSCTECASFVCEYLVECERAGERGLDLALRVALLRFVCAFVAIGGADILQRHLLRDVAVCLVHITQDALNEGVTWPARMLIEDLPLFPVLPSSCLPLMTAFLSSASASEMSTMADEVASVIEDLGNRGDWFRTNDLPSAVRTAATLNQPRLSAALQRITKGTRNQSTEAVQQTL